MSQRKIGFAICGSFCTFSKIIEVLKDLKKTGADVYPIMSFNAFRTDTRFGKASEINSQIESICQNKIIKSIAEAEPIGPKQMFDILIVAPCTGNTLAKLALGITDTPVTMAAKSHLRNQKPLLIAVSTNDGLSNSAKHIGNLLNTRNIFFVPMCQDDAIKKPRSIVCDFGLIIPSLESALELKQIQPIFI